MRGAGALLLCACSVLNGFDEKPRDAAPVLPDAFERLDGALPEDVEVAGLFSAVPSRDLDLLFVVDNSATMLEEQAALAASFPTFIQTLEQIEGGLPNVHIGVISSNVGIGDHPIANCTGSGDDGLLQNTPRAAGCSPPTDRFIVYERDAAGTETTNYSGTLAETFSCIAQLGNNGCGFERHLESTLRALDGRHTENDGFLRETAYLAVIFLADEDDCSAADEAVYDPNDQDPAGPLGPLGSFRCSEFGILCDGAPIGREPRVVDPEDGVLACAPQGRTAATDEGYLWHPQHYVDFLKGVKRNPALLVVAAIVAPAEPVEIVIDDLNGGPKLAPACTSAGGGTADPAVRLRWLVDQFPSRGLATSICDENLAAGLGLIGETVASSLGQSCVVGPLADWSPADGLQPECRVWDVVEYGQPGESRTEVPACGAATCYRFETDAVSCPYDTNLKVVVDRASPAASDVTVVVECRRP